MAKCIIYMYMNSSTHQQQQRKQCAARKNFTPKLSTTQSAQVVYTIKRIHVIKRPKQNQ